MLNGRFLCYVVMGLLALMAVGQAAQNSTDPYETFNRHVYAMNKTLDDVILKPATTIYKGVLPWPVRTGVSHAFSNLNELPSFANHVLQGNADHASLTFFRFVINSTIGLLGFFDVASHMGLVRHEEDFGMTLVHWGDTNSPFVVVPFLGPSTVRDAVGMPFDLLVFGVYTHINSVALRNGLLLGKAIDKRATLLGMEGLVTQAALDPYVFERNAYLQHRQEMILRSQGVQPTNDTFVEPVPDPFEAE